MPIYGYGVIPATSISWPLLFMLVDIIQEGQILTDDWIVTSYCRRIVAIHSCDSCWLGLLQVYSGEGFELVDWSIVELKQQHTHLEYIAGGVFKEKELSERKGNQLKGERGDLVKSIAYTTRRWVLPLAPCRGHTCSHLVIPPVIRSRLYWFQ